MEDQTIALLRRREELLRPLIVQPGGPGEFAAILAYIVQVGEVPPEELRDFFTSLGPDALEIYVTTAEILEALGQAISKAEDILVAFDERGIDVDDRSRELIQSCADLDTLTIWFRRSLKVDKASDLFQE
jgi:S1-C subfamily serine protease